MTNLTLIDLAYNKLTAISGLDNQKKLTELWVNNNSISDLGSLSHLKVVPVLESVYIEGNPVVENDTYLEILKESCPLLK